jgi:hypothetical protein
MFGTLILTYFLLIKGGRTLLRTRLSLISDNQGNIFAFEPKDQTDAHLCLSDAAHHDAPQGRSPVQLAPSHMKRDYNQWADELTHPNFAGFRPDRQLPVSEAFSQFKFLWSLLDNQQSGPNSKRRKTDPKAT